jgi:hypothetical protein
MVLFCRLKAVELSLEPESARPAELVSERGAVGADK